MEFASLTNVEQTKGRGQVVGQYYLVTVGLGEAEVWVDTRVDENPSVATWGGPDHREGKSLRVGRSTVWVNMGGATSKYLHLWFYKCTAAQEWLKMHGYRPVDEALVEAGGA